MAAKNATNGFVRLVNGDTFEAPGPAKIFKPQGITWSGGSANGRASIVDANGVTVCYMSIAAAGDEAVRGEEFYGKARPWQTPITASMSGGLMIIGV
jgi:hypothetical protein